MNDTCARLTTRGNPKTQFSSCFNLIKPNDNLFQNTALIYLERKTL